MGVGRGTFTGVEMGNPACAEWQALPAVHRPEAAMVSCQARNAALALRPKSTSEETTMATHKLLLLPGDGIGPEVMGEVKRLIDWLSSAGIAKFETDTGLVGGSAYDAHKVSISGGDMAKAKAPGALIFGGVGGPKWDAVPYGVPPQGG